MCYVWVCVLDMGISGKTHKWVFPLSYSGNHMNESYDTTKDTVRLASDHTWMSRKTHSGVFCRLDKTYSCVFCRWDIVRLIQVSYDTVRLVSDHTSVPVSHLKESSSASSCSNVSSETIITVSHRRGVFECLLEDESRSVSDKTSLTVSQMRRVLQCLTHLTLVLQCLTHLTLVLQCLVWDESISVSPDTSLTVSQMRRVLQCLLWLKSYSASSETSLSVSHLTRVFECLT